MDYAILPAHTETPPNTIRKIANAYIELKYHFLTLQETSWLPLKTGVQWVWLLIHVGLKW